MIGRGTVGFIYSRAYRLTVYPSTIKGAELKW
jgi:hypothetical protein